MARKKTDTIDLEEPFMPFLTRLPRDDYFYGEKPIIGLPFLAVCYEGVQKLRTEHLALSLPSSGLSYEERKAHEQAERECSWVIDGIIKLRHQIKPYKDGVVLDFQKGVLDEKTKRY